MRLQKTDLTPPKAKSGRVQIAKHLAAQATCQDIEALDREGLLTLWQDGFGTPAPKGISLTYLRRFVAFDAQSRQQGGLPGPLLAKLGRLEAGHDRAATPSLKPGGRFLREWNGVTHVVDVTSRGYLWQGQCHRSLSAIARAITGAQWSGPRFFGLNEAEGVGKASKSKPPVKRSNAAVAL